MHRSNEYAVFYQDGHLPVHYDPIALQFTEISDLHEKVLADFRVPVKNLNNKLSLYSPEEQEAFNELCDAELINVSHDSPNIHNSATAFRPNVVAFRIVLTEHCNLCCAECFVTKNKHELSVMCMQTLDATIDKIIEYSKDRQISIQFFGGEPILKFDYIEHAVERLEREAKSEVNYSITTNATLISHEVADFFRRHHFRVAVSVDGGKKLHDKLRPHKDGSGSYDVVKSNIKLMQRYGLSPSIIITPHPQHLKMLGADLANLIEDFDPPSVAINTPFDYDTLAWSIDGHEFAQFLIKANCVCEEHGVEMHSALSPILAALSNHVPRNSPCSMLCNDIMVLIRTDGKMSFCAQKWHDDMVTITPRPEDSPLIALKRGNECEKCVARTVCGGPCPAYQIISGEQLDHNKCKFMHAILAEIVDHLDWYEEKG